MSLRKELIAATDWIEDLVSKYDYGSAELIVKFSKEHPLLIEKSFSEKIKVSRPFGTPEVKNEKRHDI